MLARLCLFFLLALLSDSLVRQLLGDVGGIILAVQASAVSEFKGCG